MQSPSTVRGVEVLPGCPTSSLLGALLSLRPLRHFLGKLLVAARNPLLGHPIHSPSLLCDSSDEGTRRACRRRRWWTRCLLGRVEVCGGWEEGSGVGGSLSHHLTTDSTQKSNRDAIHQNHEKRGWARTDVVQSDQWGGRRKWNSFLFPKTLSSPSIRWVALVTLVHEH